MTTKSELIAGVADDAGVSNAVATKVVDATFEMIGDLLAAGDKVTIAKFGSFEVKETKERNGHNPATGAPITIPAGRKISFKPSTDLKDII